MLFGEELAQTAQSTKEEASSRAERIRVGMVAIATLAGEIKTAWTSRDWVTLSYASWEAYVEGEFGEHRLPMMTREQRRDLAVDLRSGSMSTRAISAVLGVDQATVVRDLNSTDAFASVEQVDRITGIDGKDRPATRPATYNSPRPAAPSSWPTSIPNRPPASTSWQTPTTAAPIHPERSMFGDDEIVDAELVEEAPHSPPAPAVPVDPEAAWSDAERDLVKRLRDGETVVLSLRGAHANLIRWAEFHGLYVRIDRRSEWGNPFEMPGDGDRNTVIRNYAEHYLPHKPSLLSRMSELRGKALGCWCAPDACHGDVLKEKSSD